MLFPIVYGSFPLRVCQVLRPVECNVIYPGLYAPYRTSVTAFPVLSCEKGLFRIECKHRTCFLSRKATPYLIVFSS